MLLNGFVDFVWYQQLNNNDTLRLKSKPLLKYRALWLDGFPVVGFQSYVYA